MPFTKHKPKIKQKDVKGFILYEGKSELDGAPVVGIATLKSSNIKTGNMIQTWFMRSDIAPTEAVKSGLDVSVCGNCPHRHYNDGACYVNVGHAPLQIYKSYKRGLYPKFDAVKHSQYITGRRIRLGSYGDPASVPYKILKELTDFGNGWTGYTHQISHRNYDKQYNNLLQISADTPNQALKYQQNGGYTFRVALPDDDLLPNEIECKADSQGITCQDCGLCNGQRQNIAIVVHGSRKKQFKSKLIAA